ncbi:hypothetical protein D3C73_1475480 [compost metagenome]
MTPLLICPDSRLPNTLSPMVAPSDWNSWTVESAIPLSFLSTDSCTMRLSPPNSAPIPMPRMTKLAMMYRTPVCTPIWDSRKNPNIGSVKKLMNSVR